MTESEISEMAGDWIKMRTALAHDPAVIAIALDLDKGEFEVVGMLHHLWSWADSQSENGHIKRVTSKWIDRFVHCDGFAKSMEMAKWLIINDEGIEFPNFDRHNGDSAKKRAEDAERKRKSRERMAAEEPSKTSGEKCDQNRTREEKRREDKEQDQKTMSEAFAIFWKMYPKKVSKADAVKAWGKIKKDLVPVIMQTLPHHCMSEQWVKDNGQFVPNAATWLNKKRWEDEVKPYVAGQTNRSGSGASRPSLIDQVNAAAAEQERRRQLSLQPAPGADEWEQEFANIREIDGSIVGMDD